MSALYPCDFCDYYTEQHNKGCCCRVCYATRNGTAALSRTNNTFSGVAKSAGVPRETAAVAAASRCIHAKRPHRCHDCVLPPYAEDSGDKLFAASCSISYACRRCGCALEGQCQSRVSTTGPSSSQGLSEGTDNTKQSTTTIPTRKAKAKARPAACTPCRCCARGVIMKGIPYELYEIPKNGTAVFSYLPHARGQGKERDLERAQLNSERMKFMY